MSIAGFLRIRTVAAHVIITVLGSSAFIGATLPTFTFDQTGCGPADCSESPVPEMWRLLIPATLAVVLAAFAGLDKSSCAWLTAQTAALLPAAFLAPYTLQGDGDGLWALWYPIFLF